MKKVARVSFKQVYDLVFRARNSRLNSTAYSLDFIDWVKAGVAFNTRGFELSSRKISYFAKLYNIIVEDAGAGISRFEKEKHLFEDALIYYYEDIYEIYQDHLESKQSEARQKAVKVVPDLGELLILPRFDGVPELREIFKTQIVGYNSYECRSLEAFRENARSAYLKEDTALFRCMSLLYDYGCGRIDRGVLLEVELWNDI